jgi:sugar (pentulose or hexulose) kinase
MLADILGRPVSVPADPENATAMGAFLIAAEALGLKAPPDRPMHRIEPRPERAERTWRLGQAFAAGTTLVRRLRR